MDELFKPSISEENGLKLIRNKDINILSVGVSTCGSAEMRMLENNNNRHVIATTIDESGLMFTKDIMEKNGLANKIEIKIEDISENMPYENEYFDFVYARLVLHYLDNKKLEKALKEIYRVLKNDGLIFIVVRSTDDWESKLEGTTYCEETGLTKYPKYKTLGTDCVKYIERRFHDKQSIETFLKASGFKIVHTKQYNEQLYHDYTRNEKVKYESSVIETLGIKKL